MRINGFQKMTLLDYPGKLACTVFTSGCNMRCPFCHNAFLVTQIDLSEEFEQEDILSYIRKRRGVLDGVCVTGGEPLLHRDAVDFLMRLKETGISVKLDTNGTFPERLRQAVEQRAVDYVAMDIKNSKGKYPETVGVPGFDISQVEESVAYLLSGAVDFEFRTTVVKQFHLLEDINDIAAWIKGAPRYFLQCFKDSGNLIGEGMEGVDEAQMKAFRDTARRYVPETEIRGL